jgi:glycosyltransferase involved in cell wall biosynthesis
MLFAMKAEEYHQSLGPLGEACRLAGWGFLTCPLTGGRLMILFRHFSLVFKIYKIRRRRILLREFSTLPLLTVWPLLWPLRKNLYFLIHHNLQWTNRSRIEFFGLSLLADLGAHWALLETQEFHDLTRFNIPADRNLVLPHPIPNVGQTVLSARKKDGLPIIGVAGWYRPEKGMSVLVELLQKTLPEFDLLLGIPNPEAAAHLDALTVDTSAYADYMRMLSRCDVLVQNSAAESYFYRASGPVADAAACGTAVVVPDFPVLRSQISSPVSVGEVFRTLEMLPDAVRRAVENVRSNRYDFNSYCTARAAQKMAEVLNEFSRRQNEKN